MKPETPFRYSCVNCVSIIPASPGRSREGKVIYVGALDPDSSSAGQRGHVLRSACFIMKIVNNKWR